jgi:hypothetical protein
MGSRTLGSQLLSIQMMYKGQKIWCNGQLYRLCRSQLPAETCGCHHPLHANIHASLRPPPCPPPPPRGHPPPPCQPLPFPPVILPPAGASPPCQSLPPIPHGSLRTPAILLPSPPPVTPLPPSPCQPLPHLVILSDMPAPPLPPSLVILFPPSMGAPDTQPGLRRTCKPTAAPTQACGLFCTNMSDPSPSSSPPTTLMAVQTPAASRKNVGV